MAVTAAHVSFPDATPMKRLPTCAFLVAATLAPLAAQTASATPFGTGCAVLGQQLAIGATGLPQLGTTFTIDYTGPNVNTQVSTRPVLALGVQATAVPIPPFLPQQPATCTQYVVPDVLLAMAAQPSGGFVTQVALTVPNDPALLGYQFVGQWFAIVIQCGFVPPCWFDALPTSNALQLTVGL